MSMDAALGRWTAYVVHPQAAWRRLRPRGRALLVGTYAGAGYLVALIGLIAVA